ncbi:MAG: hypothetical protein KKF21_18460 [Bacteroidetes bacterium]|nr:hypothetical protein [Bacteroidota bacterium]
MIKKEIMENIFKSISTKRKYYPLNGNYIRPTEKDEVIEKLMVHSNGRDFSNIDEYLDSLNKREMNFYNSFMKKILPSDSMNPHIKPYPPRDYFVDKIEERYLTHIDELNNLLKYNNSNLLNLIEFCRERDGILHIGEKGSGKTFSQNVWLYENKEILKKNKIFWVRLDASKLVDIWQESADYQNANLTTTEEYFLGQLVYVFSKHFIDEFPGSNELFVEIAKKLKNSVTNEIPKSALETKSATNDSILPYDLFTYKANKKGITTIIDYLKELERQIATDEYYFDGEKGRKEINCRPHMDRGFLLEKVLLDSQNFANDRYKGSKIEWVILGEILKNFILANDYYILYIVDGIDNVNYLHNKSRNYIDRILRHLYSFPLKRRTSHPNEMVIISLRDTTYESLKKLKNESKYIDVLRYKDIETFYRIRQDSAGIQKLAFDKRVKHVLRIKKCDDCYMQKVMELMLSFHNIPDESRWNANIRCFMHNHLTLAKLITFRYYFADQPTNFDIQEQINTFEDINFLLNGELFVNEQTCTPISNKGHNLFNLFGYIEKDSNQPSYFIYTRLLQLILKKPNIFEVELYDVFEKLKYQRVDIDICLDKLISEGLIKSTYSPDVREKQKFLISSKGKFALNIFYSNLDYLYYSCLNTALPESFLDKIKVSPYNYTKSPIKKRFYPINSLMAGVSFLILLTQLNNYDPKFRNIGEKDSNLFQLPIDFSKLSESIEKMIDTCYKDSDYNKLLFEYAIELNEQTK